MNDIRRPSLQQEAELQKAAEQRWLAYAKFHEEPRPKVLPTTMSKWEMIRGYFDFTMGVGPAIFDWRNHLNIPPAKDQGKSTNSCTSFAIASAIEIQTMIATGSAPDVAAQHMHTCVVHQGEQDLETIRNYGVAPRILLDLLVNVGYAHSQPENDVFQPNWCPSVEVYRTLQGYSEVPLSMASSQIAQGPIVTDMYIWPDFYGYSTRRSPMYIPDMSSGRGRLHSVCVVGFTPQAWIIKNSYGSGWGDGTGFGLVKRGACGLLTNNPPPSEPRRIAFRISV